MGRRQPAQRPTIAQDGVFLNHGMQNRLGRWLATSSLSTGAHIADQQTGPSAAFRQEITPCRCGVSHRDAGFLSDRYIDGEIEVRRQSEVGRSQLAGQRVDGVGLRRNQAA